MNKKENQKRAKGNRFHAIKNDNLTENYKVSYPTFPQQKNKSIPCYENALKANTF